MQPFLEVLLAFALVGALVAALVFFFAAASDFARIFEEPEGTTRREEARVALLAHARAFLMSVCAGVATYGLMGLIPY